MKRILTYLPFLLPLLIILATLNTAIIWKPTDHGPGTLESSSPR